MVVLLLLTQLNAIECKQEVYRPALKNIPKTLDLLAASAVTPQTLKALQSVKVTKAHYLQDIKALEEKLTLLQAKKEAALKAKKLSESNVNIWNELSSSCKGKALIAAQKVQKDVNNIDRLITQRLSTIEHYINMTQMGLDIGKKRYAPTASQ